MALIHGLDWLVFQIGAGSISATFGLTAHSTFEEVEVPIGFSDIIGNLEAFRPRLHGAIMHKFSVRVLPEHATPPVRL